MAQDNSDHRKESAALHDIERARGETSNPHVKKVVQGFRERDERLRKESTWWGKKEAAEKEADEER